MSVTQSSLLPSWINKQKALEREIQKCLNFNPPQKANFSRFNHIAITLALRTFVYDINSQHKQLPVIFMDDSTSPPFPIGCIPPGELQHSLKGLPLVRLGLMSCRHPELDYIVDLYVTQNRQINQEASMAEQEQLAYQSTVNILNDSALDNGVVIELYHTGLEPMVVGCYRGIVQVLKRRIEEKMPRNIIFYPLFCQKFNNKKNKELSRYSHGAKIEDYIKGEPWF